MDIMTAVVVITITIMAGAFGYLVTMAANAASDPDNSFTELEFAVSSMALIFCAILISYFVIVYVVPEAAITQSSTV